jgi:hypothetical protein
VLLAETSAYQGFSVIGQYENDLAEIQITAQVPHSILDIHSWAEATHKSFVMEQFADLAYAEPEYLKAAYIAAPRVDR